MDVLWDIFRVLFRVTGFFLALGGPLNQEVGRQMLAVT